MPTITRTQVRQEMLKRAPILGRALTADSLVKAGPTLTDVSEYQRQRAGLTSYEGQYIYRPALADPDNWRLITTVDGATGIVSVDGPSYVDNTTLPYERLLMHPDDLNFAIAEGQRRQRVKTNIALVYPGVDLDMEAGNALFWDGTSGGSSATNMTVTKSTTVAFSGTKSLQCIGTGASPTLRSSLIRVSPDRQIYMAAITLVNSGPLAFKIYDFVAGTYIGATVTQAKIADWTLVFIQANTGTSAAIIQFEFSSNSAACQFWVDTCFGPYLSGKTEYDLQTSLDEAYKLRFVRPSGYISPQDTAGLANADSLTYIGDLIRPEDWDIEAFRRDVHFNRLRFQANSYNNSNVGWGGGRNRIATPFMLNQMRPIWLAMEAQVSDFEPLLTEAATTNQPLDECACYSLRWLAETMTQRDPQNPVWQSMLAEYKMWSVVEDMGRPPQAMYTPQRYHAIRA